MNQITAAFKIITADDRVKAILVNIFGGIMKCDVIAEGVVAATKEVRLTVPTCTDHGYLLYSILTHQLSRARLVMTMPANRWGSPNPNPNPNDAYQQVGLTIPLIVRLEGTNVAKGKEIIKNSGLAILSADDLDDAAQKAVAALKQ